MDASGNLDNWADFTQGMKIRLVSYLNPDVVFGVKYETVPSAPGMMVGVKAEVQRLSVDSHALSELTVFMVYGDWLQLVWYPPDGSGDAYPLYWTDERGRQIDMNDPFFAPQDEDDNERTHDMQACAIDFVDGCWFALNNWDRSMVADVYESGTTSGNQIVSWPWNGGANQIWRAQKL